MFPRSYRFFLPLLFGAAAVWLRVASPLDNPFTGKNLARYSSPDMDSLVDRYYATVAQRERIQVLAQILRLMTDQLPIMTLFYDVEPSLVSNHIVGYNGKPAESTGAWNVHRWDLK